MNRALSILNTLGMVIMLFSATMVLPMVISLWTQDGIYLIYWKSIGQAFLIGLPIWLFTFRAKQTLRAKDGFLLVVMVWASLPVVAALPLVLYFDHLSVTDAYFETVSGLTTTGATVLSGLDALPVSINVWRTQLHWIGGMGIIVLAVAVLPLLGIGGMQLYKAETPGPMKDTKLTPRITETAKRLWFTYATLTMACLVSLKLAGMSWLDALIHSFSTMGTGGFSSHDASIGYYNSPAIEAVLILFMMLAGWNFATHFLALRQKSPSPYLKDPELRAFLWVMLFSCILLAFYLRVHGVYPDTWTSFRYVAFNTVSLATTTGFANTDYNLWPFFAPLWMLFLGTFSTSSGSTGGGIKMVRAILLVKQGLREMKLLSHPQAVLPVKFSGQTVQNQIIFAILAFMFLYFISTIFLTFVLILSGLDFISALSAVVACMNTIGPGLNTVGPATTYAALTDFQTWLCTFAMLLGRLELFTLLILLTPAFWQK